MTRLFAACLILLTTACTTLPAPTITLTAPISVSGAANWAQRRAALALVRGFTMQGRIAQPGLGRSGDLIWHQSADGSFELQLSGPFGVGAVSIKGDDDGVVVRTKDGSGFTPDPEQWMQTHLGWSLPLPRLRAWALGIPDAGPAERVTIDNDGLLRSLQQNGWTIEYPSYQAAHAQQLPRRLELRSPDVHLRLVIDRWETLDLARRP